MTIIKLDYEDIKPALSIDQKGFEKENIVPGSIRAYKEFGQSMKVDGMRFGVTNLVTFEEKLKGEDLPYRTTCVMDDSGRVRGFLEVQEPDRRIPMDLQAKLDAHREQKHILQVWTVQIRKTGHVFLGFEMQRQK